jgi:hypothetical protein
VVAFAYVQIAMIFPTSSPTTRRTVLASTRRPARSVGVALLVGGALIGEPEDIGARGTSTAAG